MTRFQRFSHERSENLRLFVNVKSKSKQCIAVSNNLASSLQEIHMPYAIITVLPATWQRCISRLYPQPEQALDLATPEGCKAELTYVT